MDDKRREEVTRLHATVCSALADPVRILLLYTLAEKSCNVGQLVEQLELPQPTVSRHLKILREQQMVVGRREGQAVYYSLTDERVIDALNLLLGFMADKMESQGELVRSVAESN